MPSKRFVLFSFLIFGIVSIALIQTSAQLLGQELVAGRNVNMVNDDPFLQRQNEPSFDVSSINPRHLLAGANDYSLVDFKGDEVDVTYDSWLGVFKSYDGGESWEHDLLPPYQGVLKGGPADTTHPLYGFDAGADPTIRAGKNGWFYYSGIAFNRERNGRSVVFVMRYKDNGSSIDYMDTTIIDEGTSGQFQDKPWIGTDKNNRVFIIYSIFLGKIENNIHSKIMISRSLNKGDTWLKPTKISESQQKNQGTTIAIDQNYDTIYVAWRRFRSVNENDAILIVRSEDFGATFVKAEEVATIDFPFDQPTMGSQFGASQFRTNSYPTIAVDNSGRIYLAWAQRISDLGDARIVITSLAGSSWGATWPTAQSVEAPFEISGYQFMPTMLYSPGANKLLIAWFDTRFSARRYNEFGEPRPFPPSHFPWIRDDGSMWLTRETADVRLTQTDPGPLQDLDFDNSIQVSRYLWVLEEDPDPTPGNYRLRQGQFNPPNYKMFSGGTTPFHGDYIDIAQAPDDPFTYYVTWTDNRDVRPPGDDGFWGDYTPPVPFDPENPGDCNIKPENVVVGMRNQNVYCSKITRGVNIGTFQNNLAPGNTSFVIFVQNLLNPPDPTDPYASEEFYLDILDPELASFSPLSEVPYVTNISISVPFYSTIARQIFVKGSAGDTFKVGVSALNGGFYDEISLNFVAGGAPGGTGSIVLNGTTKIDWNDPDLIAQINPSITNLTNPTITNPTITNPTITNPTITNPTITNPTITNPTITNPTITNPGIPNPTITNPTITNPTITNPTITNANIINPTITNPTITNIPPETRVADKVWSVHNDGSGVSAYTFKGIAGEDLPTDGYVFSQLLIYKVHYTHSTNGCYLLTEAHHELLVNVISPILTTDMGDWTQAQIQKFIGNPEASNATIDNATFSLAPGEHAVLILRVIDTKVNRVSTTSHVQTLSDPFIPAPINYDEADSVFVPHPSTESNPTGAASLMILPDSLLSGVKAGDTISAITLRAIGGTLGEESDYDWSIISGSLPEDMTLVGSTGTLSGYVREIGPFSFTVQASDDIYDPNQTAPDRSHFDTHTFTGDVLEPDPLTLKITTQLGYDSLKHGDIYDGMVSFTASGGVPQYFWTFADTPVEPTSLSSGLSLQPTGNPGEMELVGTLMVGEWEITVEITDDRLPADANAYAMQTFTLCVKPLPMAINLPAASELEWSIGTSHTVQISVSNAVGTPTWTESGLPSGFSVDPSGSPVDLTGLPVFDPSVDYPAIYPVDLTVKDPFTWCDWGPRFLTETFDIIVNPKAPEWDNEETNGGVATAVAADKDGNTYVTGYIGAEGSRDFVTVKYDSDGLFKWSIPFDTPYGGDDKPNAIAADETGVYVTGFSEGTVSGKDIYTIKYNPGGGIEWDSRYDGPSHLGDEANVIAQDDTHVYVAGFVHRGNKNAHKDMVIIKLSKDYGEEIWDARFDSTRNGKDEVTAIAVDNSGYVYAAGKSQEGGKGSKSFDFLTLKFDSSGQLLWEERDDGFIFGDDEPTAIAVDATGNVCVTGWQNVGANDTNFYTVKYNTDGGSIWSSGQSYGESGEDKALAVAFDEAGNVYVTGKLTRIGDDAVYDYATVRYNSDTGLQEWDDVYESGNGEDIPVGLAFSMENGEESEGFVYVAGYKTTDNDDKDYFCIKYREADGSIVWIGQYNHTSGSEDEATAMFMNATGLYVTGFTTNGYLTVKYTK